MPLIEVKDLRLYFNNGQAKVIDGVSFSADKGQFVSIVGPSGCGKSTMLRIIAGLIRPTSGSVLYMGKEIIGPVTGISFVFQDFALLPWLTNIENVELGLSRFDVPDDEKKRRAADLLDKFGLGGFANDYPNVISGGMKQRVGIARAIASEPNVLLMDEPFSSLDVLTAETLRGDIMYMLNSAALSVNCVIMVTHNVEEAVEVSNSVVILSNKPAVVKEIREIGLPYPRDKHSEEFLREVDQIYATLTD
ncbi:MAG: ABC transporter ATP-binding protein [Candidatus Micrarchaeota archaeon]|nr:ABC transporter ATP-binding protein [Candidatus Micrarchaeota archaeon]